MGKVQSGVVINFEKSGVDPPPVVHDGEQWCTIVGSGARWWAVVHDGEQWCMMVSSGARW